MRSPGAPLIYTCAFDRRSLGDREDGESAVRLPEVDGALERACGPCPVRIRPPCCRAASCGGDASERLSELLYLRRHADGPGWVGTQSRWARGVAYHVLAGAVTTAVTRGHARPPSLR